MKKNEKKKYGLIYGAGGEGGGGGMGLITEIKNLLQI